MIEGKTRTIRLFKLEGRLSETTRSAPLGIDPANIYREASFADCPSRLFRGTAAIAGEVNVREVESYTLLWLCLIAIGLLADAGRGDDALASAGEAHDRFFELIGSFDPEWLSQAKRAETVQLFGEFAGVFLEDEQVSEAIGKTCGYDASPSISAEIARWVEHETERTS